MLKPTKVIFCLFLLILCVSFAFGDTVDIRILHINDFHGFAEPYKPLGSEENAMRFDAMTVGNHEFDFGQEVLRKRVSEALGVLNLRVQDGKIIYFEGHLEEIKPKRSKEDKSVKAIVDKYNNRVNALVEGTLRNRKKIRAVSASFGLRGKKPLNYV